MKNVLIFSFFILSLVSCGNRRSNGPSPSPATHPIQNESLQKQMKSLQNIVDKLNQLETDIQALADKAQKLEEVPESAWFDTDKSDLSDGWLTVKERLEFFRQVVKNYYSLLQKEYEGPSEPLSLRQAKLIEDINKISRNWLIQLSLLNKAIDNLGSSYSEIHEQHQLTEIITDWNSLYKRWSDFSKKLHNYQVLLIQN
ncbi:MAG: hypothetical protein OXJ52_08200 [Oligoflexia bacterium]|nr:hypothetical protein [Oligoflexia bacterium]